MYYMNTTTINYSMEMVDLFSCLDIVGGLSTPYISHQRLSIQC